MSRIRTTFGRRGARGRTLRTRTSRPREACEGAIVMLLQVDFSVAREPRSGDDLLRGRRGALSGGVDGASA